MKIPFTNIHYLPKTTMCTDKRFWGDAVLVKKNRVKYNKLNDGFFKNIVSFWGDLYKESGKIFYGVVEDDYITAVRPYDWG